MKEEYIPDVAIQNLQMEVTESSGLDKGKVPPATPEDYTSFSIDYTIQRGGVAADQSIPTRFAMRLSRGTHSRSAHATCPSPPSSAREE